MATAKEDFKKWFVESLSPLRANGDAGFVFALIAFPLLERYLRAKSECREGHNLTTTFYANLGRLFPGVSERENAFWDCYRNGLLHQVTFPKAKLNKTTEIWVNLPEAGISGYDPRPVYFLPATNQFFLNPIAFFDFVTGTILADFSNYESASSPYYQLPQAWDLPTGKATIVPTINTNIPKTGSYLP